MTYKQDLVEQIVLDHLAIREFAQPGEWFYRCRIAAYQEEIKMLEENENVKNIRNMNEKELYEYIESNRNMSPEEKQFAKFFYHETILVKDMDILTLRAHREELVQIAAEARARISAADEKLESDKRSKRKANGPSGIERNLNTDETTTSAINKIKERTTRMSKLDRAMENLKAIPGMDPSFVESLMKNKNILDSAKRRAAGTTEPFVDKTEKKIVVNPFAKKAE